MNPKLRKIFLLFFFLFATHAAEEYVTRFFNVDPIIRFLSQRFLVNPQTIFFIVQFVWLGSLLGVYLLGAKKRIAYWLTLAIGFVLLFELGHIVPAIINLSYYPGFYTSIVIVLVSIHYWKTLLRAAVKNS